MRMEPLPRLTALSAVSVPGLHHKHNVIVAYRRVPGTRASRRAGEYEAELRVVTDSPKADTTSKFRFTLFESESDALEIEQR